MITKVISDLKLISRRKIIPETDPKLVTVTSTGGWLRLLWRVRRGGCCHSVCPMLDSQGEPLYWFSEELVRQCEWTVVSFVYVCVTGQACLYVCDRSEVSFVGGWVGRYVVFVMAGWFWPRAVKGIIAECMDHLPSMTANKWFYDTIGLVANLSVLLYSIWL